LTRQRIPVLDRERFAPAEQLRRGAYVLADLGEGTPQVLLMASGSEVPLIIEAGESLHAEGLGVRLISFPSWELFAEQDEAYRRDVLLPQVRARVAIEAGSPLGWERWVGDAGEILGLNRYGVSAPYEQAYEYLGLTSERVIEAARRTLARSREREG
jgi:transketolase